MWFPGFSSRVTRQARRGGADVSQDAARLDVGLAKQRAKASRYKEWFESAMVMVDNVPSGVAWSDPKREFEVTYVNALGAKLLAPCVPGTLTGRKLPDLFPPLGGAAAALRDPARLPLRIPISFNGTHFDLQVLAITNAEGDYIGVMAVWNDVTERARLASRFEQNIGETTAEVQATASRLHGTMRTLNQTANQTIAQARRMAAATEQASASVQRVAAATVQLSGSVGETARQIAQSSRVTARASTEAERTDAVVCSLAQGAQRIGEVVNLISGVARQTNILALNVAIEAARAGEAGKGFAVVAGEVRSLAAQTTRAAEEISTQISQIQAATGDAVKAIRGISATVGEVNQIANEIALAVEEQGKSRSEKFHGLISRLRPIGGA